jgi:uroporphyrinogen-III synthase
MRDNQPNVHITAPCIKLPLLDLRINNESLQYVADNISDFDVIIFTSPKSINACAAIIANMYKTAYPMFYVMGEASAGILRDMIVNTMTAPSIVINYPKLTTGSSGLVEEVFTLTDFSNKRVLLVKGSCGNIMLEKWLSTNNVDYVAIDVYDHVKIAISKDKFLSIFVNRVIPRVTQKQNIVITSGLLVDYLFELALKYDILSLLIQQRFLTIHAQIADKLVNYGVSRDNIVITLTTNKSDLLTLMTAE